MGAAIQGALINGDTTGPVLVDITPHTLGINCLGDLDGLPSPYYFAPIIPRNTALPASRSEMFGTVVDNQPVAKMGIYQGESHDVRDNEQIGEFSLEGLAEVEAGNQILVRFDLDLDGILKITSVERMTGLEKRLTIDNSVSKFRQSGREAAQARLSGPLASEPALVSMSRTARGGDAEADLPSEVTETLKRAAGLIADSERMAERACAEDAEEIRRLLSQLGAADPETPLATVEQILAQLEDLVFYLKDAE
jgi:molecular chaperone DnaK